LASEVVRVGTQAVTALNFAFDVEADVGTLNVGTFAPSGAADQPSNRLSSVPDDPVDQLRIRQASLARRKREVRPRENRVWVRLDEIDPLGRRRRRSMRALAVDRADGRCVARLLDVPTSAGVEALGELIL
jgi:hypothetical protein